MSGSIAESLTMLGLVVGFPLLLLGLMIGLEKLESWGLREHEGQPQPDRVDAAVQSVEHMMAAAASQESERAAANSNGQVHQPVRLHD